MEVLNRIAGEWELDGIAARIEEINRDPRVNVGFLGDFSSGKSTLINEYVRLDELLPTRVEPCTANSGVLLAVDGLEEPRLFRLLPDDSREEVGHSEFDDVARGLQPGRPLAWVPPAEGLPSGLALVDTPGLGSMNFEHAELTFGELPYLDAAVLCLDIQKGGLTGASLDFLHSPGVQHLRQRFLLALTHGDTKTTGERDTIRESVTTQLAEVLGRSENDAGQTVVIVSAGPNARVRDISELRAAIGRVVLDRRASLERERRERALRRLIPHVRELLTERRAAIEERPAEFEARLRDLKARVAKAGKERADHRRRLSAFRTRLEEQIKTTCTSHRDALAAAGDDAEVAAASEALAANLEAAVTRAVGEFAADFDGLAGAESPSLKAHLATMNRGANLGKTLATAALTAWILPGAGVVKDGLEAGAGALGRKVAAEGAKKTVEAGFLKTTLRAVLQTIDDINPVNFVGDLLATQIKRGTLRAHLEEVARSVSHETTSRLERLYDEQYFAPLREQMNDLEQNLEAARGDRQRDMAGKRKQLARLDADLAAVLALA